MTISANKKQLSTRQTQALSEEQKIRFKEIGMLTRALLDAESRLEREINEHKVTRAALARAKHGDLRYLEILSSTSWRITAPLRWISTKTKLSKYLNRFR